MVSPVYFVIGLVTWPAVRGLYRLRARGLEYLPESGFVLAANHVSNLDPWALGIPLWPHRKLRFMAKAELFNPVLTPILNGGGAFKVRRGEGDRDAMRTAIELARDGEIVVMFPEGTRQQKGLKKRHVARAHSGAARIALAAGVPLVPAAIAGTDRLLRLARLRVAYGTPIDLGEFEGQDTKSAAEGATEQLMTRIEELHAGL